ncbi:hypothetical protein [Cetobacterium sp.]|uniref:hypothetical protein n=1 Tax=Cetobacterium sp. TaxID=2071632 RepID=UPI003F66EB6D
MKKVIELRHLEELIELIERRDCYNDFTDSWSKYNERVKDTINLMKRNAFEVEDHEDHEDDEDDEDCFYPDTLICGCCSCCGCSCDEYDDE